MVGRCRLTSPGLTVDSACFQCLTPIYDDPRFCLAIVYRRLNFIRLGGTGGVETRF